MLRSIRGVILASLIWESTAFACPCGCGAVGPLVMWPGELWKMQYSLSHETIDGYVGADGKTGPLGGADSTELLSLGLARALGDSFSLTLNAATRRDSRRGLGSEWSVVDPTVGARYTVRQVDFDRPWLPQVAIHASYKHSLAKMRSQTRRLEVEGVESSEFVPGVDLWFYHGEWALGLGQALEWRASSYEEGAGGRDLLRGTGLGWRRFFGFGYTFIGSGQILAQWDRETKGQDHLDGQLLEGSDRLQQSLITGNLRIGERQTLSVMAKGVGLVADNRNTKRSRTYGLSYLVAL